MKGYKLEIRLNRAVDDKRLFITEEDLRDDEEIILSFATIVKAFSGYDSHAIVHTPIGQQEVGHWHWYQGSSADKLAQVRALIRGILYRCQQTGRESRWPSIYDTEVRTPNLNDDE